jgi:hypothetical protein
VEENGRAEVSFAKKIKKSSLTPTLTLVIDPGGGYEI